MAKLGDIVWRIGHEPRTVAARIDGLARHIDEQTLRIAEGIAEDVWLYMTENHPWVNRTGDAEAALTAEAVRLAEHIVSIYAAHGVDYGIWLEIRWGGKWGIIPEALQYAYPRIMRELQGVFAGY